MSTETTVARALELYSKDIGVPVRSLSLKGESPSSEELRALWLCEREDAVRAFLAGREHFEGTDRLLIAWVLNLARREAYAEFGEHVVRVDTPG